MRAHRLTCVILSSTLCYGSLNAQSTSSADDSLSEIPVKKFDLDQPGYVRLSARSLVIPGLAIAYGATALKSNALRHLNDEVKEEIWLEKPHQRFHLDNYLQYAPAAAVYGLNIAGVKGKHNMFDRSMIYGLSNLLMFSTVNTLKKATAQERPDGSADNSFPSGHTAEAFASAEFLRQEYKDVSPWYGVAGYAMAATTGYLRMYNNKHWLSDVVAGAGVGIISTKLAYWLYPKIQHIFGKTHSANTMIMPSYNNKAFGLGLVRNF